MPRTGKNRIWSFHTLMGKQISLEGMSIQGNRKEPKIKDALKKGKEKEGECEDKCSEDHRSRE